jgi:hypothetical protein
MNNEFSLRDEILRIGNRWPYPLLAFILGSLIGLGLSLLLPIQYRAESRIGVSYNADVIFRNPDDFKNAEMESLNTIVLSESVVNQTLSLLHELDPYWNRFSIADLTPRMRVYWRNTGTWRLVAKAGDPSHATQLVQTWKQVVIDTVNQAIQSGTAMANLNQQIKSVVEQQVATKMRLTELTQVKSALGAWRSAASTQDGNQSLDIYQSWYLRTLVARVVLFDAAGRELLGATPKPSASILEYLPWVDRAIIILDEQLASIQNQTPFLDSMLAEYTAQWNQTYAKSLGLSSYLGVESIPDLQSKIAQPIRTHPLTALVGGAMGILIWVLSWLALPFLREKK